MTKIEIDRRLDEILEYLNTERVRCTYGAVGQLIDAPSLSVGTHLRYWLRKRFGDGDRRPETSWVVSASTGEPTGYEEDQKHPELRRTNRIIITGEELKQCLEATTTPGV